MGKYIIELKRGETAYKTVDSNGTPLIQLLAPTSYAAPDLEQVRKEAYAEGFKDGQYAERNGLVANYAQVHKIKIGDEVENTQTGVKFIVTHLWENNQGEQGVSGFNQECSAFSTTLSLVVKTGRTFPEIATVLEKMRGEQLRQAQRGIKHE